MLITTDTGPFGLEHTLFLRKGSIVFDPNPISRNRNYGRFGVCLAADIYGCTITIAWETTCVEEITAPERREQICVLGLRLDDDSIQVIDDLDSLRVCPPSDPVMIKAIKNYNNVFDELLQLLQNMKHNLDKVDDSLPMARTKKDAEFRKEFRESFMTKEEKELAEEVRKRDEEEDS